MRADTPLAARSEIAIFAVSATMLGDAALSEALPWGVRSEHSRGDDLERFGFGTMPIRFAAASMRLCFALCITGLEGCDARNSIRG